MNLTTYNQVALPIFMYGTAWKKEQTTRLVQQAVLSGFKSIDTANQLIHYQEALVGEALLALKERGVQREDLFLQTKFTTTNGQDHRTPYDRSANLTTQLKQSIDSSLSHLHTDYLDSYVLHGPHYRNGLSAEDWEIWAAIEEFYNSGKTRIIGVSNVSAEQLALLCNKAKVKPMLVQNRCYAALGWDQEVRQVCKTHGIIYQGFSLLTANSKVVSSPALRSIANRLNATASQVVFRFAIQIGMLPLTGTTSEQHMKEDLAAEQLELTPDEMKQIETISL